MIRKGDTVKIKPQWQDHGDDRYTWRAVTNEEGGRVMISQVDTGLTFPPTYNVKTEWLQ